MRANTATCLLVTALTGSGLAIPSATAEEQPEQAASETAWPEGVVREADLPAGFPPPAELGIVVEKTYPAARSYWAEGNLDTAFRRCYRHLREHNHEMTAPVAWDYRHPESEPAEPEQRIAGPVLIERLHFYLEDPTADEQGQDGPVTVEDLPEVRVLSIAFQGRLTKEAVLQCEAELEAALSNRSDLISDGDPRILGYNSPMIAEEKRYWEIQRPVRAAN